jgi:N-methylhydantoinase B
MLRALIKQNVRAPDAVFGDLAAQVASGQSASERLMAMCRRYRLIDIEGLSDKLISRSEAATRAAIGKLKWGTFHGQSRFDVPGGEIVALKAAVTIGPDAGEILVDFTGSSPQTRSGINVCSTTRTPTRRSRSAHALIRSRPTTLVA